MADNNFSRDASNRLTFEVYQLPALDYPATCADIAKQFGLEVHTPLVIGLNEMFRDWNRGDQVVGLEWDIWSGFLVTAKNVAAEELVREIGEYLNESEWAVKGP